MTRAHKSLQLADLAMGLTHAPVSVRAKPAAASTPAAAAPPQAKPPKPSTPPPSAPSVPVGQAPAPPPPSTPPALRVTASWPPTGGVPAGREARAAALEALRDRHARECPHCTGSTSHTHLVFGEGDPTARLMFVGEAPGETEDRVGRPFVGRAGEKLDEMIRAMGLSREQVYIANVLKSRPPENRTPLQHEVDACGPFLIEQLLLVRPEVVVTLGGPATKLLLGTETGITRLRGVWAAWNPPAGSGDPIPVMPTYHPAYLLRNYTPKTRGEVWSDLKAVMERLGLAKA